MGAGQNILAAHYPLLVRVGGLRIAFLAYVDIDPKEAAAGVDRPGVAWLDPAQALADIRFARPLADLVIVCPHWGVEYALKPTRDQVELAHQMIDAGADMIVGSHPHVVQPLENYHDRWIAYSLGNFVFDQKDSATHRGLMLRVTVRDKQIAEVLPLDIKINSSFQAALAPIDDRSSHPSWPRRVPSHSRRVNRRASCEAPRVLPLCRTDSQNPLVCHHRAGNCAPDGFPICCWKSTCPRR